MPNQPRPLVLVILDGYGISFLDEGNAVKAAKQPNMDRYMREYPIAAIRAAGIEVGLPWGEMGNSETGHKNMGAGRVFYQMLPRVAISVKDKSFFKNEAFLKAIDHVKKNKGASLHTMGLLSNGGVHAHIDHQLALLELAAKHKIGGRTFVHAFLDGRDSPPDSASNFVNQLVHAMKETGAGKLASMIGRYYAMDRNKNWDRTRVAYNLLVHGQGKPYENWKDALKAAYKNADTKNFETAPAMVMTDQAGQPIATVKDGDAVIFYNYRPDRAVQLTAAFVKSNFKHFPTKLLPHLAFVTFAEYAKDLPVDIAYPEDIIEQPLGRVLSQHRLRQLRIAESEKYALITNFLNGGNEKPFPGEDWVAIPSKNVKDYSKLPAMSAEAVTDRVVKEISRGIYDFVAVNYANPDMVAHTGNFNATVKALEFVDRQLARVVEAALTAGGAVLLTCDHGNAELVVNPLTHERTTDHTSNPVPLIYIADASHQSPPKDDDEVMQILSNPIGVLSDVAPTVLDILGIRQPKSMTAQSLLNSLV